MALDERTRAYQLLRSVSAYILMYGEGDGDIRRISITEFQSLFLALAFTPNQFSRQTMEAINNGSRFLNLHEAEQLVTYLITAIETKTHFQVVYNEKIDDKTGKVLEYKEITYYPDKHIENYDKKKEIFDSALHYFYEVHNIIPERIQELLENRRRQIIPWTDENRYQVIFGDEVTEKDIDDAIELDSDGYDGEESYIGIKETCYNWYKKNPFIYFMVRDLQTQKIVGYINAMPITDELYETLKKDKIDDINIPYKDILRYNVSGQYNLYFTSIVVKSTLRNSYKIVRKLIDAITEFFIEKTNDDIIIKRLLAKEVSIEGRMLCQNMGMKSQNNDSIFEVSMYPPEFNGRKDAYRKLFDCYQTHYDEHQND